MSKYSTNEISEIKIIKMNIINMRIQFGMKQSRERERFFFIINRDDIKMQFAS